MPHADIASALQLATSPVILVSAVCLLLLTMNNRIAHSVDRARALAALARAAPESEQAHLRRQIDIIWARAQLLRRGIEYAAASALCSSILVVFLFLKAAFGITIPYILSVLIIGAGVTIALAVLHLILDVRKSLRALSIELGVRETA